MGKKKSRAKASKKNSAAEREVLQFEVSKFSKDSIHALVQAASCSPTAAHRLPSIGRLFLEAVRQSPGEALAQAHDLAGLLNAARSADPRIALVEDYLPDDPRLDVRIRWNSSLFRLSPSCLERPVAMFERARLVASSIDSVLVGKLGFGLDDVCELVLRHVDSVCAVMAPTWGDVRAEDVGAVPFVQELEVAQAATIPDPEDAASRCSRPDRALRALEWATLEPAGFAPAGSQASFGTALRLKRPDHSSVSLPVGFWLEALDTIINELASLALENLPDVDHSFYEKSGTELGRILHRLRRSIRHNVPVGGLGLLHSVIRFDQNCVMAVDLSAALQDDSVQGERCLARLEEFQPDARQVLRVHVVSGPGHMVVFGDAPRVIGTTLDDMRWIVERCSEDPDDVFLFFREFLEHPNVGRLIALETINAFEHWWNNGKCLFKQGGEYDGAVLAFHRGEKEWIEAARRLPLERSLLKLGLSRSAVWDAVSLKAKEKEAMLTYLPDGPAWMVRLEPPTVGVHCFDSATPFAVRQLLLSLVTGVFWRIEKSEDLKALIGAAMGDKALKLWFQPITTDEALPVLRCMGLKEGGRLIIAFDGRLQSYCEEHSTAVEDVIGAAIAEGLSTVLAADQFLKAWSEAPPGFRMDGAPLPVGRVTLPPPEHMNTASRSEASRALATRLRLLKVDPGKYEGRSATTIDSGTIYPELISLLSEVLAPFSSTEILGMALTQLERSLCESHVDTLQRNWNEQFPVLGYDPVERKLSEGREAFTLSRAIRVVIEEVLRRPPGGTQVPDRFDWWRVLAVADLCVRSGTRSEINHYGLVPVATSISEMYEVAQHDVGESLLDMEAFHQAKVQESDDVLSRIEKKDLEPVALAMEQGEGYRPETVGLVLETIAAWDVEPKRPYGIATLDELVAACYASRANDEDEAAIRAAIRALTLTGASLNMEALQHWEQEKRRARVMTKPIIESPDTSLLLLPWQSHGTWRVFQGYLSEGRCMWPTADLSASLQAALLDFREERNRAHERDVANQFLRLTPLVRPNVKKPKVLGLNAAEWGNVGEIDVVAVDQERRAIWVGEAKDVFIPFSPSALKRSYEKYFVDKDDKLGYVQKLLAKAAMIDRNRAKVLARLGLIGPYGDWHVKPVMVTRRVEPAGFARGNAVAFCAVADLVRSITSGALSPN